MIKGYSKFITDEKGPKTQAPKTGPQSPGSQKTRQPKAQPRQPEAQAARSPGSPNPRQPEAQAARRPWQPKAQAARSPGSPNPRQPESQAAWIPGSLNPRQPEAQAARSPGKPKPRQPKAQAARIPKAPKTQGPECLGFRKPRAPESPGPLKAQATKTNRGQWNLYLGKKIDQTIWKKKLKTKNKKRQGRRPLAFKNCTCQSLLGVLRDNLQMQAHISQMADIRDTSDTHRNGNAKVVSLKESIKWKLTAVFVYWRHYRISSNFLLYYVRRSFYNCRDDLLKMQEKDFDFE